MKAAVQKLLSCLLYVYLAVFFVLIRADLDISFSLRMFLFSTLPLLAMIRSLYRAKLPFREIRKRKFRLTVYCITIALFLLCMLSWAGILPVTHIAGGISKAKGTLIMGIACTLFGALAANLGLAIRDGNRWEQGLPI